MTQLEINGINLPVNSCASTWKDLLQDLESRYLGKNKVIASVHFDGSEVVGFREAENMERSLQSLQEIRVEAIPMEQMVKGAVDEAEHYVVSLQTVTIEIAEDFRHQRIDEANAKLTELFRGIKMLVALLQGVELQLSGQYHTGSTSVEQVLGGMGPTVESLISAQTERDWLVVADILEFELVASLSGFERSIAGYKQRVASLA